MEVAVKQFLQIGILVRDIEKAVQNYEEKLGIGPWEMTTMASEGIFSDLQFDGKAFPPNTVVLKVATLHRFGFEIELIQPVADSPYKRWIDKHGPGIHHIAVKATDDYEEVLTKAKEATGKEPWVRGTAINGLMDFSYLDLRDELGVILEVYKNEMPGKPGLDYNFKQKGEEN